MTGEPGMRVIAIDGPVGSGKSTIARAVARRLGMDHLETGAMYRAVAYAALLSGMDVTAAGADLARLAAALDLEMGERVLLHGSDVTDELRTPEVTRVSSVVAADRGVRLELVRRQRTWAALRFGGVIEGRDIGSVVFPDAVLKVFLTATKLERARRRAEEDPGDVARRDAADSSRTLSPLVVAEGALVIDTTDRTVDDIVDEIVAAFPAA